MTAAPLCLPLDGGLEFNLADLVLFGYNINADHVLWIAGFCTPLLTSTTTLLHRGFDYITPPLPSHFFFPKPKKPATSYGGRVRYLPHRKPSAAN